MKHITQPNIGLIKAIESNHTNKSFINNLNWDYIAKNWKLTERFIDKFIDKLYLEYIVKHQHLTEHLLLKYADKWDWTLVLKYQRTSPLFKQPIKATKENKMVKMIEKDTAKVVNSIKAERFKYGYQIVTMKMPDERIIKVAIDWVKVKGDKVFDYGTDRKYKGLAKRLGAKEIINIDKEIKYWRKDRKSMPKDILIPNYGKYDMEFNVM